MSKTAILAAIDLNPLGLIAAQAAMTLKAQLGADELDLVHVVNLAELSFLPIGESAYPMLGPEFVEAQAIRDAEAFLTHIPIAADAPIVRRTIRKGIPARDLCDEAQRIGARAIVTATHGRSALGRILLGSVSSNLVRLSSVPVLVVGEERPGERPFKEIVAGVDLSANSSGVLIEAAELAARANGRVTAVGFYSLPLITGEHLTLRGDVSASLLERERRIAAIRSLVEGLGLGTLCEVSIEARESQAARGLMQIASERRADLIVLGSSGHNAFHRLVLGSTAGKVLSHAECPVLMVPHPQPLD